MRSIVSMDTVQIETTNHCIHSCSNCTRFCGHHYEPYHMDFEFFKKAVDSMVGYPKMVGMMGGEPLLHPEFERLCEYALSKIPRAQLGLWSCFPSGKEHLREVIVETFGNVFLNDHTRDDIYHCPILVAAQEVIANRDEMFSAINECWLQHAWSAAINPRGAFFCEIAASMSLLFDPDETMPGWPVRPGWWWKTPKDFTDQIEEYCPLCGVAIQLPLRASTDGRDDVSQGILDRLMGRSRKIDKGKYVLSDLACTDCNPPMAAYKDQDYRDRIADRYGIFLTINEKMFLQPHLKKAANCLEPRKPLWQVYRETYGGTTICRY